MTTCLADNLGNQFQFRKYAAKWDVIMGGKKIGFIHQTPAGFCYRPKGPRQTDGEAFPTFAACQQSVVNG